MLLIRIYHSLLILIYALTSVQSAKILAIFPSAGPSQYIVVERYLKALAERGHELTVISNFPQKKKIQNFHDITIKCVNYEELIRATMTGDTEKEMAFIAQYFHNITLSVLENSEVQELLFTRKEHFDLVITELCLTESLYAIASHLNAHSIGFSSFGTDVVIDQWTGNPSPLSYIPIMTTSYTDRMNFWQRLYNFIQWAFTWYHFNYQHFADQQEIYRKYFPHLEYELLDICKNFSLVLLNQHFSISYARPYVTNLIEVGGLYLQHKPTSLPEDIKNFIDDAEHGVIYFSMGSNVKSIYFDEQKRIAIMNVLGSLKQRVLWKFENTELPGKPSNVMIKKWFPQPDILAHPNVKLFITHAGSLSIIETVYHAKPIVGIPIFFDQFNNIARAEKIGIGIGIKYIDLNEKSLREVILEVLHNQTYTKAVQAISKRFHDQPINPLDHAIYWTEYVLRHDGASFMRVTGRELNFWQYFSIDIISFTLGVVLLSFGLLLLVFWTSVKIILRLFSSKRKNKVE